MGLPYVGEIRMFAGTFAPAGWALCDGQLLAIYENETLFQLIGTTYGGDGVSTFSLPYLQGSSPMHKGPDQQIGETGIIGIDSQSASTSGRETSVPGYLAMNFIISLFGIFPSPDGGTGAEPFLSEGRLFAFHFAPRGWAQCNGQRLPINQNQALFSLLGTTYGGNGQTNFQLPDLRGSIPMHTEPLQFGDREPLQLGDRLGEERAGPLIEESIDFLVLNYCIALQGIFPSRD